ncbi:hypothetical protein AAFF_G00265010 [Aldrovandia affinis]|uniref:Secreted protein n=1 Tax=Aldrovandia affinis TaxID=143900 RepID=A0AAD7RBH0_9TELE|nr:hypothetical protein AAFF_G00265010 [Aldrovandia affinis]
MVVMTLGLHLQLLFSCALAQSTGMDNILTLPAALRTLDLKKTFIPCCLLAPPPPPLFPPSPAVRRLAVTCS